MGNIISLVGQEFGRLSVLEKVTSSKNGHARYICLCKCGKKVIVFASNLRRKHTESCGCLNLETNTKHGQWGTRFYWVWHFMLERCRNKHCKVYNHYGGRGITVCQDWYKFDNFYRDMHSTYVAGLTIERKDVNGNYSKDNCVWATKKEQSLNKRNTVYVNTIFGKLNVAKAASLFDLNERTLRMRIKSGWPENKLLLEVSQIKHKLR